MGDGRYERRITAAMNGDDARVRPISDAIAYPLHRRTMSLAQRHGRTAGLVAGGFLFLIGLMFLGSVARQRSTAAVVIGVAAMLLSVVAVYAGRALGSVRSSSGIIAIQPDRLEIADDRALPQPILLRRDRIMAICSPGMTDDQPAMRVHIRATHDVMRLGDQPPNVEIWLATPIQRPDAVGSIGNQHRPIAVIELLTPAAGTLVRWFREGLTELVPPKWYEGDIGPVPPYNQ